MGATTHPGGVDGAAADGDAGHPDRRDAGRARAAGETAPLLFTALFSNYWLLSHGHVNLMQPTASLAVLIYNFAGMPFENQVELAWAAALVLVLLVLVANLIGQSLFVQQRSAIRRRVHPCRRLTLPTLPTRAPPPATSASTSTARRRPRLPHQGSLLRQFQGGARHRHSDQEECDHRLHRPVRLRQEHGAALPQSHERPGARLPLRGPRPLPRPGHLRIRRSIRSPSAATSAWCSSSPIRSPRASTTTSRSGCG